jgi:peptidoglycan hydrolase-like protein with peptidoglycan-binding domain
MKKILLENKKKYLGICFDSPIFFAVLSMFVFYGCATTNPEMASIVAQPKTPATRNITSFTPALACMDNLFASYGFSDTVITSAGIPDATGEIQVGTKDMMISAISKMSIKSKAFRFVDYDPTLTDVNLLHDLVGIRPDMGFEIPNYYIRGAITQLDSGVASDKQGGGIALPAFALGLSKDQILSVVSMDMNMGDLVSRQILPGIQATNSITVVRSGKGGDMDGKIGSAGIFFNMSMDRSEGMHQSVRALLELSLIETLGKLSQVPYWRCLGIGTTNPKMQTQAREWFDMMTEDEKIVLTQRVLVGAGYMGGEPSGRFDQATQNAIGRYQAENNLIADGRINFDLYYNFLGKDFLLAPDRKTKKSNGRDTNRPKVRDRISNLNKPIKITVSAAKEAKQNYYVGDKIQLNVTLSDRAYTYCYYEDAENNVVRIYPNQFAPDAYIPPSRQLLIPSAESPFDIKFERRGQTESFLCMASRREVGIGLPKHLMVDDLVPIKGYSLDRILADFNKIDRTGLSYHRLDIRVH